MRTVAQLQVLREGVKPTIPTRAWHRIQERIRHPALRRGIARFIASVRPRGVSSASPALNELFARGIVTFPKFISDESVLELRDALKALPCFDPWAKELGEFSHENIPSRTHVAQIRLAPCVGLLHDLASDPRILDLAAGYFGCRPYLDSIQAWWSLSGHDQAEEAENFHRDNDSIRFLKFFIYLTDVGEVNGPHVYVAGSHTSGKLLERRRLTDEEVREAFGSDVLCMTGRAGDAFIEDTYGIHKGQLPMAGRRLLVQFRYSLTETIFRSPVIVAGSLQNATDAMISLIHDR